MASRNTRFVWRNPNHNITHVYILDSRGEIVKELKVGMMVDTPIGPGIIWSYISHERVWQVQLTKMTCEGRYMCFSEYMLRPIDDVFDKVVMGS